MNYRRATIDDSPLLAQLNQQLIRDEGHRNAMSVDQLEARMQDWLAHDYAAILFEDNGQVVAYALYREQSDEIHLRQLFVVRQRRREGIGRSAVDLLRTGIWSGGKRLTVEVLIANEAAVAFWRSVGYKDYCLTLEVLPEQTS